MVDPKAVMNTRIALRAASREHSRVIMDRFAAADLPADPPGRMVLTLDGKMRVYQGYYLPTNFAWPFRVSHGNR